MKANISTEFQNADSTRVVFLDYLSIPHFKGLGKRNLEYEIGICQKNHIKCAMTENV